MGWCRLFEADLTRHTWSGRLRTSSQVDGKASTPGHTARGVTASICTEQPLSTPCAITTNTSGRHGGTLCVSWRPVAAAGGCCGEGGLTVCVVKWWLGALYRHPGQWAAGMQDLWYVQHVRWLALCSWQGAGGHMFHMCHHGLARQPHTLV